MYISPNVSTQHLPLPPFYNINNNLQICITSTSTASTQHLLYNTTVTTQHLLYCCILEHLQFLLCCTALTAQHLLIPLLCSAYYYSFRESTVQLPPLHSIFNFHHATVYTTTQDYYCRYSTASSTLTSLCLLLPHCRIYYCRQCTASSTSTIICLLLPQCMIYYCRQNTGSLTTHMLCLILL
jgi:hypothetical protein